MGHYGPLWSGLGPEKQDARGAYKPDSVQGLPPWMAIHLAASLPIPSSCLPGSLGQDGLRRYRLPDPDPRRIPIRHCSRWGLPCGRCCQPPGGLLPHRFTLTRRGRRAVYFLWRFPSGFPARALPGTCVLWSPDFPLRRNPAAAATQPPAQARVKRLWGAGQRQSVGPDLRLARNRSRPTAPWPKGESAGETPPKPPCRVYLGYCHSQSARNRYERPPYQAAALAWPGARAK